MHTTAIEHSPGVFRRYSFFILLAAVAAFSYLNYWAYSQQFRLDPDSIVALANGTGFAPAQYRIGLIYTAKLILHLTHGHISYRHSFAVFDFFGALSAVLLLRTVLFRSRSFAAAAPVARWLRVFILIGLAVYYMGWSMWYQRPETWFSAFFVAASLYVLTCVRSGVWMAGALVGLAVLQGAIRSDVAIVFHFGLFVYVLFRGTRGFLVSKPVLLTTSAISGLTATIMLWMLIHRIFPHANYGDTPVFQLLRNFSPDQLLPAFLFLIPTLYVFLRGVKQAGGPQRALLLSAALYFLSWAAVGRLQEVRIFVPFAFALMPLTADTLASRLEAEAVTPS